jgi:hypothetical protein
MRIVATKVVLSNSTNHLSWLADATALNSIPEVLYNIFPSSRICANGITVAQLFFAHIGIDAQLYNYIKQTSSIQSYCLFLVLHRLLFVAKLVSFVIILLITIIIC